MSDRHLWLCLSLGAGLACLAGPVQAGCGPGLLEVGLGLESSVWQEQDASGASLLEERGTLRAGSAALAGPCAGLEWTARLDFQSGQRDYQGRSSSGAALETQSQVRSQGLQLQAWQPQGERAWSLGARLGWEPDARRDLASVGAVQGYEEIRDRWRLGLGGRWRHALPADWSGLWEAWLDSGPRARLRLQGEAFGSRTVRLDEGRWHALALAWTASPAPVPGRWQPWLGWHWEALRSRASAPVGVQLDSGRVLAVSQPAYRQTQWRLMAGLRFTLE